MQKPTVKYDEFADSYYAQLPGGHELWCACPQALDDVLQRLNEREQRREEHRSIVVAILLGAVLLALAAMLGGCCG